jgi:hypothetical protein
LALSYALNGVFLIGLALLLLNMAEFAFWRARIYEEVRNCLFFSPITAFFYACIHKQLVAEEVVGGIRPSANPTPVTMSPDFLYLGANAAVYLGAAALIAMAAARVYRRRFRPG